MQQVAKDNPAGAVNRQSTQLDGLKKFTKVVADTGEFSVLSRYAPQDATTNPSLILKAAQMPDYEGLIEQAISDTRKSNRSAEACAELAMDNLLVLFGTEILKIIPGRVSTETDASLSFDTDGIIRKAQQFIALYQQHRIDRERVLIKIASTWEGIRATEVLQRQGIQCNMTLLFSLSQAAACAEAKAALISPFVGRILDWHKSRTGKDYSPSEDPGVQSVREIYAYYKYYGYTTEVMGASFRNRGEILELAGCDALTISPKLLGELQECSEAVERRLSPERLPPERPQKLNVDEKSFRWLLNENAMATEKLAEGIRLFNEDATKLKESLVKRFT